MLMELLYQNASGRPDDPALVYRDERVTQAELADRVERLAAGLAAEGIGAGDAVALLLPNDPTFVASYYAISALGGVVVPVNPAFKQDELEFYFRQCDVRAVISDDRSAGVCERIVVLNFGEVLTEGRTQEVLDDSRVVEAYLGEKYARRLRQARGERDQDR